MKTKKLNNYTFDDRFAYIEINSPKYGVKYAKINIYSYWKVKNYTWGVSKDKNTFYAFTTYYINGKRTTKLLHKILNPTWRTTDHWDKNGLNNTRENLRECTHSQNNMNKNKPKNNTSGFKGVNPRNSGKFQARIMKKYKSTYIGNFNTAEEAARAYDKEALKLFGKWASLNFPKEDYM